MSIAGSDSGGGAGVQADIKTASAFGVFATTAVTAVTVQNTVEISAVEPVSADAVAGQIRVVLKDIGADAIKIGMAVNAEIIGTIADALTGVHNIPIVLDPVMVSTSGNALLAANAVDALRHQLLPCATVLTPNLPELDVLAGKTLNTENARVRYAQQLVEDGLGGVLIKGGHDDGDMLRDVLVHGDQVEVFSSPRLKSRSTHGTGCTLSTAIACGLANGEPLIASILAARRFVYQGIDSAPGLGSGAGPLNFLQDGFRDK